jgi:hypothetical protein
MISGDSLLRKENLIELGSDSIMRILIRQLIIRSSNRFRNQKDLMKMLQLRKVLIPMSSLVQK